MDILDSGILTRLRVQQAFRESDWVQTPSGLLMPLPRTTRVEERDVEPGWVQTSSGFLLPTTALPKVPYKPTCISLFTGAGGFDLGFHSAGWRIVAASDYDTDCARTYIYNMGSRPIHGKCPTT